MIRTIIFDLDDTILWDKKSIQTAFDRTCEFAAEKAKVDPKQLEEKVRESARELYASYDTYEFTQMIGINPFEGLWGSFEDEGDDFRRMRDIIRTYQKDAWTKGLKKVGVEDYELANELVAKFISERRKAPFVFGESFEVLESLKKDYRLVLLTNGAPSLQNEKLTITPEISPYFDFILISGDFGKGKPDASIFLHVLEKMGTQADEALMVGDNLMTDILGANRAGIRSVWLNREGSKPNPEVKPTYEIDHLGKLADVISDANR
ncbi:MULTISPECIES: HAD family hydrolase [Bhargavaea]|uniref:Phosphoserine phosphatase n=1 Tax=Bhargavaea changchunensis TaxID=2134037 RepID=A0ABW2NMN4_9BACL|nr:HAD family hydrolase [Bhargavaea sp. CC-171006]